MTNQKQITVAKEAIDRIFGNTDQSPQQTREDIQDVIDHAQLALMTLPAAPRQ